MPCRSSLMAGMSRVRMRPGRALMGVENMGPSVTQVWNSPFSPRGSTAGGRSARKARSKGRAAKVRSRWRPLTLVMMARRPWAIISRASSGVGWFQSGKTGVKPVPASWASR